MVIHYKWAADKRLALRCLVSWQAWSIKDCINNSNALAIKYTRNRVNGGWIELHMPSWLTNQHGCCLGYLANILIELHDLFDASLPPKRTCQLVEASKENMAYHGEFGFVFLFHFSREWRKGKGGNRPKRAAFWLLPCVESHDTWMCKIDLYYNCVIYCSFLFDTIEMNETCK